MPHRAYPRPVSFALRFALFLAAGVAAAPLSSAAQSFTAITTGHPVVVAGGHRGASWIDADGDGDLDLHVTRGGVLGEPDDMYWNEGGGVFSRDSTGVLSQDGLRSDGATWGDFDNDGDADPFSTSWYGEFNALWTNDGARAFTRVTTGAAVTTSTFSEDASWADYDNDGDLDLFVANSGNGVNLDTNLLYRNDGGGALTPVTTGPIVTDAGFSRHGAWGDWDDDGDVDLYVAREKNTVNVLYKNLLVESGMATFQSVAAGDATTDAQSSLSASWGDVDNDGDLDLVVANFTNQKDAIYENQLVETGTPTLTKLASGPTLTNGYTVSSVWGDFDNDADLDLFMTNGFSTTPGETRRNFVFRNDGGTLVRDQTSPPGTDASWSYGATFGDMDGDGDLDLFVANWLDDNAANFLYRNDAQSNGNHWLQVKLVGVASNRSGIGARVRATATIGGGPVTQTREVSGSNGYASANLIQHFGLAGATTCDVEVRWPSGTLQRLNGVAADQLLTIVEASSVGIAAPKAPTTFAASAHPNPFRDSTTIRFELPTASGVKLDVFDAAGRRVSALSIPGRAAGSGSLTWDGRDSSGSRVPSGVYFYRVISAHGTATGKVGRLE